MPNHANDAPAAVADAVPIPPALPCSPQTWARIVAFLLPDAHHWGRVELDVSDGRVVRVRIVESLPLKTRRE